MGSRILLDTNLLIDVLANRKPFFDAAALVWNAHVDSKIDAFVAAVSLTNFFYVMRRETDKAQAWNGVERILDTFHIVEVSGAFLNKATRMRGRDFEDNVQIACAEALQLDAIVTRDETGFRFSSVPFYTPHDFLRLLNDNGENSDE